MSMNANGKYESRAFRSNKGKGKTEKVKTFSYYVCKVGAAGMGGTR